MFSSIFQQGRSREWWAGDRIIDVLAPCCHSLDSYFSCCPAVDSEPTSCSPVDSYRFSCAPVSSKSASSTQMNIAEGRDVF